MPRKKITLEQLDPAIEALKRGATYKLAAEAAGVAQSTFYKYLRKGREGANPMWKEFFKRVQAANHERSQLMLQRIEEGSRKDWRAAAWLLETRYLYRKNAPMDIPEEEPIKKTTDPIALLQAQIEDLQKAINSAAQSQSWQAYAALQRQLVSMVTELRTIEGEKTEDGLERMTDEQLIGQIEAAVLSMPPVLRQRLQNRLTMDVSNVVSFKG
jgi:AcrR family transcriptional regulator